MSYDEWLRNAESNNTLIQLEINGQKIVLNNPSDVWKLRGTTRGIAIEKILADTEYKDWWNCGAENNGYFPIVHLQKDMDVVSLKSIAPSLPSYSNGQGTDKIIEYLDSLHVNITIDGNAANLCIKRKSK